MRVKRLNTILNLDVSYMYTKHRTNMDYCSRVHNVYSSMHLASPHHDELQQDKYGGQHFRVFMVALP
jgi:hypothetical protein